MLFLDNASSARGGKVPCGKALSARMFHLKVFALAAVFGLGAYAVILGIIHVTRALGFIDWVMR